MTKGMKPRFQIAVSMTLLLGLFVVSCKPGARLASSPSVSNPPVQADTSRQSNDSLSLPGPDKGPVNELITMAMILPLRLSENFAGDSTSESTISPLSMTALQFYEGALLAADSMKSIGVDINFRLVDAGADSNSFVAALSDPAIKSCDEVLVFHQPSYSSAVGRYSRWNSGQNWSMVQASNSTVLESAPALSLVWPSNHTQVVEFAAFMESKFPNASFIAVYREKDRSRELADLFASVVDRSRNDSGFTHLINYGTKSWPELEKRLSIRQQVVIFMPVSDESFLTGLFRKLDLKAGPGLIVCGLPTWENFESVEAQLLERLNTHIFQGFYMNEGSDCTRRFIQKFQSTYRCPPLPQALQGYELVLMNAKQRLKNKADSKAICNSEFTFTGISGGGKENREITVLRYRDFKLERVYR